MKKKAGNFFEKIKRFLSNLIENHKFFLIFVLINILNPLLIRALTQLGFKAFISWQPIVGDLIVVLFFGSFVFLKGEKFYIRYLTILTVIFSVICVINSMFFRYYVTYPSISYYRTITYVGTVGDAVEAVLKPGDFIYLLGVVVLIFLKRYFGKTGYYKKYEFKNIYKLKTSRTLATACVFLVVFLSSLKSVDYSRLVKQWNKDYIVNKFGLYIYHINDIAHFVHPKVAALFGEDKAIIDFNEFFKDKNQKKPNKYTNYYAGQTLITIHAESIQSFVINKKINGKEITPNLNRLVKEGLYFDNFYTQTSIGTSSDTEFTIATGLMPAQVGVAFVSYFDEHYFPLAEKMGNKGYRSIVLHGNGRQFWNRQMMYPSLKIDKFYAKDNFEIDDTIGLGLADHSFFKQSAEILKKEADKYGKIYANAIMLTNHTPFYDVSEYTNLDVSKKINGKHYPYLENTLLGRYLKSVHYADWSIGIFLDELEKKGLLENTTIMVYGDHDAHLPLSEYNRAINYDPETDGVLNKDDKNYQEINEFQYELNRKVPLIFYNKNKQIDRTVSYPMGTIDILPTLGNLFGFDTRFALGHDIFSIKNKNYVMFTNGNWLTKDVYYNRAHDEIYNYSGKSFDVSLVQKINEKTDKLLEISDKIMIYDLFENASEEEGKIKEKINAKVN